MQKLSIKSGDDWVEYSHSPVFSREELPSGSARLVAGVPGGNSVVLFQMLEHMAPPFYLLYLLHTPRGEGVSGRYQSPALSELELKDFLGRFSQFLGMDARHDVWVHSPGSNATVVWDRHNLIYAYGPTARFESALRQIGFTAGSAKVDFVHAHHYRAEYDADSKAVLIYFDWSYSQLRPEDE
ncbi:hypothetical protein [Cupriavidus pampae]|uniref:Uncharacterized protein n=1 Tax=Cupriavidus pampae TaxID=659251 RepID=A0ABN7YM72_9BURK|nr:hypothetical protein [Cupriavidus pampae]CAG9172942.1 hypothetical protein LMG32289_02726 [Cupriavidus pampae]